MLGNIFGQFYTYRVVMLRRLALFSLVHDDDAKKLNGIKMIVCGDLSERY